MKNSKFLFVIILLSLCVPSFSFAKKIRGEYATKNIVGQEYYLKRCSFCHGDGNRGGNMASIREWKVLFKDNASELYDLHLDDETNKDILIYFKSEEFKKESALMLKLLQEFAYDSEHIPTCN